MAVDARARLSKLRQPVRRLEPTPYHNAAVHRLPLTPHGLFRRASPLVGSLPSDTVEYTAAIIGAIQRGADSPQRLVTPAPRKHMHRRSAAFWAGALPEWRHYWSTERAAIRAAMVFTLVNHSRL